jgi:hypothetical protein
MAIRMTKDELKQITGLTQAAKQAEWFKRNLGADVPFDSAGPIVTLQTYEALVAKRLGVLPNAPANDSNTHERPTVRLVKKKAA